MKANIQSSLFFLCVLLLFSCNTNSYLKSEQRYVKQNEITFEGRIDNQLKDRLYYLINLKPNKGILWTSKRWFYIQQEKNSKDNWLWNYIDKNIAEKPAILNYPDVIRSCNSMENFLKNHGYFNAEVIPNYDTINKYQAKVIYVVKPNDRTTLDSFYYSSLDTSVLNIVRDDWRNRIFKAGSPVDEDLYSQDVNRIVKLMRNNGYPYFANSFISNMELDTSNNKNVGRIVIKRPLRDVNHIIFRNKSVYVYPKYSLDKMNTIIQDNEVDTIIDNVHFVGSEEEFGVNRKIIANKIELHKDEKYRLKDYERTLNQIANIPYYSFPILKTLYDTSGRNRSINYNLFLKRNNKLSMSRSAEVFYSRINQGDSYLNLLGLSGNFGLVNRNVFGGAESLTSSVSGSIEVDPFNKDYRNSYFIGMNNSLSIPQFIKYPIIYSLVEKIWGNDNMTKFPNTLYRRSKTNINVNYNFQRRALNYKTHQFATTFGYSWKQSDLVTISLNHLGVDIWLPTILEDYQDIIKENEFLKKSFEPRIISGFLLRDFKIEYNRFLPHFNERSRTVIEFGVSGLEIMTIEGVASLFGEIPAFQLNNTQFAKYLRLEITPTYTRQYNSKHGVAFRFNTGIAMSLTQEEIPYFKQFSVGGAFSMRAWPLRGLGPGSFQDSTVIEKNLPFYQSGDFKLEANAEYRFSIFWKFKGALFLDIGNVWNLREGSNPETKLKWDSYKQIAIGSGVGLRLDFDQLFIMRVDLGYPLRTPYLGKGHYWDTLSNFSFKKINTSVAFGYPF